MKRILFPALVLTALFTRTIRAADPPAITAAEVGIDEKLGAQVPLDLVLNDEEGRPVKLGDLLGKPTILTLNYFRCAGICTPLLNGMVDVINRSPG
jgi:protein SCO1/2